MKVINKKVLKCLDRDLKDLEKYFYGNYTINTEV